MYVLSSFYVVLPWEIASPTNHAVFNTKEDAYNHWQQVISPFNEKFEYVGESTWENVLSLDLEYDIRFFFVTNLPLIGAIDSLNMNLDAMNIC